MISGCGERSKWGMGGVQSMTRETKHATTKKEELTDKQIQPLRVCVGVKVRESSYPRVRYVYIRCGSGRHVGMSSMRVEISSKQGPRGVIK